MLDQLTPRQQIFALVAAVGLLVFIVEMVRRRRLREEYSWLWIVTGVAIFVLVIWFGLLEWLTHLIGAVTPVSTFFMFGILFLVRTTEGAEGTAEHDEAVSDPVESTGSTKAPSPETGEGGPALPALSAAEGSTVQGPRREGVTGNA